MRLGKVTASKISDVMAGKSSVGYQNYLAELICERLSGVQSDNYVSYDMQRGIDLEPDAKDVFIFSTGFDCSDIGFVDHATIENYGCSPDLLIFDDGLGEIKIPKAKKHIEMFITGKVDNKWTRQMQCQMSVTGRKWNEFISYCPELPEKYQLFHKRIQRNDDEIDAIESAVQLFNADVADKIHSLEIISRKGMS